MELDPDNYNQGFHPHNCFLGYQKSVDREQGLIVRSYPSKNWQGEKHTKISKVKFPKYKGKFASVKATKSKVEFSHFILQRGARLVSYDLLFGTKLNLKSSLPAIKLQDCWIINHTGNLWISAIVEV